MVETPIAGGVAGSNAGMLSWLSRGWASLDDTGRLAELVKIHTNDIGTRILGSGLGLAMLGFAGFVLRSSSVAPDAVVGDRAFWFGVTLTIAGISAVAVSWLASDLSGIWCKPPRYIGRK